MDGSALDDVLARQEGVICRRQLRDLESGDADVDTDIERRVRRREWARVHEGVYVDHTGPLTWGQRAWAAVLCVWPAALGDASALRAHGLRGFEGPDDAVIHVCVDRSRTVTRRPGIRVHRLAGLTDKSQMHLSPPRLRVEHAVLGEASSRRTRDAALAVIADAVQQRRTTVDRLVTALVDRPRLRHRRFLLELLQDVRVGAYSVLEQHYLTRVERPHGLPTGARQRRVEQGRTVAYRDVDYLELHAVVELDGRLGHERRSDVWADLERDLGAVVAGDVTLRAGWRQVLEPCRLAVMVAQVLVRQGWGDRPVPCGPSCPIGSLAISAGSSAPSADDPARSGEVRSFPSMGGAAHPKEA